MARIILLDMDKIAKLVENWCKKSKVMFVKREKKLGKTPLIDVSCHHNFIVKN